MSNYNGISKLANVLHTRMSDVSSTGSISLDFGEIQADKSLKTNQFEIAIPVCDYLICRNASHNQSDFGNENIQMPEDFKAVKAGDRVLVAWVGNDAVVVDIIRQANEVI